MLIIDRDRFELTINQRFVLRNTTLPELVLCQVMKITIFGYKANILFLRSANGTIMPRDNSFILLTLDGNSISFGRDISTIPFHDYEWYGEHITIPDDLSVSDAVDYVVANILG